MKAPRHKISSVIANDLINSKVSKKLSLEIAAYLIENRRVNELNSILRDIVVYWAQHGEVVVNVISAFPLNEKVKQDIISKVKSVYPQAKKIIITDTIDKDLVSGVQVELPDSLLDLSIKTKLNKFKQLAVSGKDN